MNKHSIFYTVYNRFTGKVLISDLGANYYFAAFIFFFIQKWNDDYTLEFYGKE